MHPHAFRVLAAALALQLAFGIVFAWGAVAPQAGWPAWLLGLVFSATPAGYGVATALGGRLAERLPPRRLCWAGLGLLALGFGLAFSLPSGLTFVTGYAFLGLGVGGGIALTGAVAALIATFPERAGTVAGAASATYAASAVFQAPLIDVLLPRLGWLGALRVAGLGMAVIAALALALMPALPRRALHSGPAPASLLGSPAVWRGAALALCGATLGTFAAVNLGAESASRHLGPTTAAVAIAAFAAGNAIGRLLAGVAADHLGAARALGAVYVLELVAAALLIAAPGAATLLLAALLAGLGLGGDAGALGRVAADAAPRRPAAAFGMVFTGFTAGAFSGPLLGALVGRPGAWLVTAMPALAGILYVLLGRYFVRGRLAGSLKG